MKNIILSEYIKQYSKENSFRFTDFDMASIVYHQEMKMDDKQKILRRIARKTRDNSLKIQISERIKADAKAISLFNENEGDYVYVLITDGDEFIYSTGFYSSFKAAFIAAVKTGKGFDIEKHPLMNEDGLIENADPVSVISFDSEGNPVAYESSELEGKDEYIEEDPLRFECRYINLPNPFTTGDVVYSQTRNMYGVVITSEAEYEQRKKYEDRRYEDSLISVDFLTPEGFFENESVKPVELEKIFVENANIPSAEILRQAGLLLRGKCSISDFISTYAGGIR